MADTDFLLGNFDTNFIKKFSRESKIGVTTT
jgi:hypothetical protein